MQPIHVLMHKLEPDVPTAPLVLYHSCVSSESESSNSVFSFRYIRPELEDSRGLFAVLASVVAHRPVGLAIGVQRQKSSNGALARLVGQVP